MNHKVLQVMHFYILSNDCKEKINLGHTIYSPDTASFIHYLQTLFFLAWLQVIRLIFYLAYVRVMKWGHVVRSNRLINDDDMYMTTWLGWVLGNIHVLSNKKSLRLYSYSTYQCIFVFRYFQTVLEKATLLRTMAMQM